ncbi:MAG: ComEC/Rec2 family competence protein [Rhizobiaceae bacterium]
MKNLRKNSLDPRQSLQELGTGDQWLPLSRTNTNQEVQEQPNTPLIQSERRSSVEAYERGSISIPNPKLWDRLKFYIELRVAEPSAKFLILLSRECDAGLAFLFSPVLFGLGCLVYFTLPREPLLGAFPLVVLFCLFAAYRVGKEHWTYLAFTAFAMFAGGASVAQLRTIQLDTTMLSRSAVGQVKGLIMKAEYRPDGSARYTLDVTGAGGLNLKRVSELPKYVRLSARKGGELHRVGQVITGRARLGPPPGPIYPGAFDFSFRSWFQGIGGSGFFLDRPTAVVNSNGAAMGWKLRLVVIRSNIARLIHSALPGRAGGLATALIVGDRSGIDNETAEVLRRSGLAHILAISGLHMALVAMTLIYFMRSLFALFPAVTLNYPIRKWASIIGLGAASIYLLLSGANVSTQRAFIMVSIMLLAVVFDRRALTMRNVAIAAFLVLLITPEAVLSPGFQMSFAAVAALVATFEVLSKRQSKKNRSFQAGLFGIVKRFIVYDLGGLAMTSLVTGLATGIFAAYHFHRVAPYGLIANLLAMPLVTLAVMPLALLSVIAMPFGLEALPLQGMAFSMEKVVLVAAWVSKLEPQGNTGFIPVVAFGFAALSLLLVTLLRTRMKLVSIPFLILFFMLFYNKQKPDLLILENGRQLGVLVDGQGLQLLRPNADKYSTRRWRAAFSPDDPNYDKRAPKAKLGKAFTCDPFGCSINVKGIAVVQLQSTAKLSEDCRLADILIIPFFMRDVCAEMLPKDRPLIIDRTRLSRFGAHSITIVPPKLKSNTDITDQDTGVKIKNNNGKKRLVVDHSYGVHPRPWNRYRFNLN